LQQLTLQAAALSLPDGVVLQLLSVNNQSIWLLDWLPAEAATQLGSVAQQESAGGHIVVHIYLQAQESDDEPRILMKLALQAWQPTHASIRPVHKVALTGILNNPVTVN